MSLPINVMLNPDLIGAELVSASQEIPKSHKGTIFFEGS
jgi:hypothetical protein